MLALAGYASSPSADARNAVVTALEKARQLGVSEFVPAHCSPKTTKRADQLVGELVALDADGRTVAKHRSLTRPIGSAVDSIIYPEACWSDLRVAGHILEDDPERFTVLVVNRN